MSGRRRLLHNGTSSLLEGYYGHGRPYYPYYARAYPYYYNPFFSFGFGFGYGYGAPFYPYGYGIMYPYGGYYYDPTPELRVQVTPRQAEVYIDGYLVGTVDDYDGTFQRLHVPFGEHQISIYREGYHTISEPMLFRPGQSYNIKQAMQPLGTGVAPEPRPSPDPNRRTPEFRGGSNDPRGSAGYPRSLLRAPAKIRAAARNPTLATVIGAETGLVRWPFACSPPMRLC